LISITPLKDPSDPETANDPDVLSYIEFMKKYLPEENPLNAAAVNGYVTASLASYILEKCGDDLTRDNVLKQAITLNAPPIGMLRQGVSIRTSPDNYLPYSAAALIRFDGAKWVAIGAPISLK
jgi:branched-chain amino acid transport system substrate-binding protein